MWALVMALVAMIAAAASSSAQASGGVSSEEIVTQSESSCSDPRFGARALRFGDCGDDVKTLNWILNSKDFARTAPFGRDFRNGTDEGVRTFQRRQGLRSSGVLNRRTRKKLVRTMRKDRATWYGPGFYGNRTACGTKLTRRTVGVAHRRLPCGTRVTVKYGSRFLRTRVIDRGPYAHGARWDLTNRAAKRLNFTHTDSIRVAVAR